MTFYAHIIPTISQCLGISTMLSSIIPMICWSVTSSKSIPIGLNFMRARPWQGSGKVCFCFFLQLWFAFFCMAGSFCILNLFFFCIFFALDLQHVLEGHFVFAFFRTFAISWQDLWESWRNRKTLGNLQKMQAICKQNAEHMFFFEF